MTTPDADTVACVFLNVAGQRWGVRLQDLRRILAPPPAAVIPLPSGAPWLLGVFHLEAEIVTLIDLARFLQTAAQRGITRPRDQAVLIVGDEDALFGLLVARLSQVIMLPAADLAASVDQESPYTLATYAPQGETAPAAAGVVGMLDLAQVVRACGRALDEGALA